ncbi:DUF421 domain-containing protein [Domibacillus robiginosus]|uniref:DUF421 domain-containing protein n=1 Tax=Domibacillus robiginosus TaxID=1071054 RepID=UPI00067AE4B9|nr:DUF421 domain-containing protein [Domibacillus robiginosus]
MDWNIVWKSVLIIVVGVLLLRLAGRKSISQMTISQTVIMISIGSLLIQPVSGKNLWGTFAVAALLIITLIILEYVQVKWDAVESFLTGRSKVVIENGKLNEKNLKKMRFSVDKLEMHLRQSGIESIKDVQWATLEPSGQLGYSLMQDKKPATKGDIDKLNEKLDRLAAQLSIHHVEKQQDKKNIDTNSTVFSEIESGHKPPPSKKLE